MSEPLPRASRASLYRLCADLLTHELDAPRLRDLRELSAVLVPLEPELEAWLAGADEPALRALRSEFSRLFLLPRGVAPYASAWLEGDAQALATQIATLVHRAMAALDLQQTEIAGSLSLDHLGLLYAVAGAALDSSEPARVRIGKHVEREALGEWVLVFADALTKRAEAPVYRALGRLIREIHG
ncbi:MAG: molecular chaperone TorD family protein [Myxococcota bacterium]|nr:molecular chaperone TorD family protein [Myxococcota bacterium]